MSERLEPAVGYLIVKENDAETVTEGGILLPDVAAQSSHRGKIRAVSVGFIDHGQLIRTAYEVGDEIVYSQYAGTELEIDGEEVMLLRFGDILGKIEDAE